MVARNQNGTRYGDFPAREKRARDEDAVRATAWLSCSRFIREQATEEVGEGEVRCGFIASRSLFTL